LLWQVNEDKCTAQRNMKAIAQGAAREGFVCCLFVCGCDVQLRCLLYPAACLLARYVLNETKIINARSRAKRRTCYYLGKQKQTAAQTDANKSNSTQDSGQLLLVCFYCHTVRRNTPNTKQMRCICGLWCFTSTRCCTLCSMMLVAFCVIILNKRNTKQHPDTLSPRTNKQLKKCDLLISCLCELQKTNSVLSQNRRKSPWSELIFQYTLRSEIVKVSVQLRGERSCRTGQCQCFWVGVAVCGWVCT
jgi:hypothetical protein